MGRIHELVRNYCRYISVPWKTDIAPLQRVRICIYDEKNELKLRAKYDEFEIATKKAGHNWSSFDLTDSFPEWLASQKYAVSYYKSPELLNSLLPRYLDYIESRFAESIAGETPDNNTVVSLLGAGSLFGLVKVKNVIEKIAPHVPGRLLVMFPGSYENNNYRLLDGYDGWNYLAVPISADKEY